jgi:hypothetical protein
VATAVGALGALAVAVGVWFRIRAALEASRAATRTAKAAEDGQITERFTKAIGQLGDRESMAVRLGGIYALEKIAQDNPKRYHWTVMEVLCAYLRDHVREEETSSEGEAEEPQTPPPPTDVQAICDVLKRRDQEREDPHQRLNLAGADLRRVDLRRVHLEGAYLSGVHLEGANLFEAHLERANLRSAHLERANLGEAHLEGASLMTAHLEGACLSEAHLERADLRGAHLERTSLMTAHLEGACLSEAHLEGAYFYLAHLEDAYFSRTDLRGALHLTQTQIDSTRGDEETQLPSTLTRPAHWVADASKKG